MTTKYIVNNVPNQTITGDLIVNGNLNVTGVTTGNLSSYKALLTQTGPITAGDLTGFNGALIIGETYTITTYNPGDDFSNVANVISGNINEVGCQFIATGYTPLVWSFISELTSSGNLIVDVLENNLGFDITWVMDFYPGVYLGFNSVTGPTYNTFERTKTLVKVQETFNFFNSPFPFIKYYSQPITFGSKDESVLLFVWDDNILDSIGNHLYYTPIEIQIKQNTDTTPIVISGSIIPNFAFTNPSVNLLCENKFIENFVGNNATVNDITELITELNTNEVTSYLGTYSEDGLGGLLLTIPTNRASQFCSSGVLSFEVYSD